MVPLKLNDGTVFHLPGAPFVIDSHGVIQAPDASRLEEVAARLDPKMLLLSARALLRSAHKRSHQQRYREVNRARVELARLCAERASFELGFGTVA